MNKKQQVNVYCTDSDLYNPTTIKLSFTAGILSDARLQDAMNNKEVKFEYTDHELCNILENFFGFHKGNYNKEFIEDVQLSRFKKQVVKQHRYTGVERQDKDWVSGSMASEEVKSLVKHGEIL